MSEEARGTRKNDNHQRHNSNNKPHVVYVEKKTHEKDSAENNEPVTKERTDSGDYQITDPSEINKIKQQYDEYSHGNYHKNKHNNSNYHNNKRNNNPNPSQGGNNKTYYEFRKTNNNHRDNNYNNGRREHNRNTRPYPQANEEKRKYAERHTENATRMSAEELIAVFSLKRESLPAVIELCKDKNNEKGFSALPLKPERLSKGKFILDPDRCFFVAGNLQEEPIPVWALDNTTDDAFKFEFKSFSKEDLRKEGSKFEKKTVDKSVLDETEREQLHTKLKEILKIAPAENPVRKQPESPTEFFSNIDLKVEEELKREKKEKNEKKFEAFDEEFFENELEGENIEELEGYFEEDNHEENFKEDKSSTSKEDLFHNNEQIEKAIELPISKPVTLPEGGAKVNPTPFRQPIEPNFDFLNQNSLITGTNIFHKDGGFKSNPAKGFDGSNFNQAFNVPAMAPAQNQTNIVYNPMTSQNMGPLNGGFLHHAIPSQPAINSNLSSVSSVPGLDEMNSSFLETMADIQSQCAKMSLGDNFPFSMFTSKLTNLNIADQFWYYRDPKGITQGPFSSIDMDIWNNEKYFSKDLPLSWYQNQEFITTDHFKRNSFEMVNLAYKYNKNVLTVFKTYKQPTIHAKGDFDPISKLLTGIDNSGRAVNPMDIGGQRMEPKKLSVEPLIGPNNDFNFFTNKITNPMMQAQNFQTGPQNYQPPQPNMFMASAINNSLPPSREKHNLQNYHANQGANYAMNNMRGGGNMPNFHQQHFNQMNQNLYMPPGSQQNSHMYHGGIPHMQQGIPHMQQGMPQKQQAMSQMHQGMSQMQQGMPQSQQGMPQGMPQMQQGMSQGMVQVQQGMPQMQQGLPQMQQGLPQMQQGLPQMQQGLPQMQQGLPQMQQGLPQMQQGLLQMQQGLPQMQQGLQPSQNNLQYQASVSQMNKQPTNHSTTNQNSQIFQNPQSQGTAGSLNSTDMLKKMLGISSSPIDLKEFPSLSESCKK